MLSTKEAAEILQVTDRRVRAMITAGKLKAKKIGRDYVIMPEELEKVKNRKPGKPKKQS